MIVSRNCDGCQTVYNADTRYLNRGQGRYCTASCGIRHKHSLRPKPADNAVCAWCGLFFYRSPSKLLAAKSGLVFCSRQHKDEAQRLGGLAEIMPAHYGKASILDYRVIAKRHYPMVCVACGYDKYPEILEVNHKDCNRSNNEPDNLEFLCPTCHEEFHFTTKTGKWRSEQ